MVLLFSFGSHQPLLTPSPRESRGRKVTEPLRPCRRAGTRSRGQELFPLRPRPQGPCRCFYCTCHALSTLSPSTGMGRDGDRMGREESHRIAHRPPQVLCWGLPGQDKSTPTSTGASLQTGERTRVINASTQGERGGKKEPEPKPHHTCLWEWFTLTTGNTAHVQATLLANLLRAITSAQAGRAWAGAAGVRARPAAEEAVPCLSSRTPGAVLGARTGRGMHRYTWAQSIPFSPPLSEKSSTRAFRGHLCVQQHLSGLLLGEAPTCSKCHCFRAQQHGSRPSAGAALHAGLVWSQAPRQPARLPPSATQPQPAPPPCRASRPGRSDSRRGAVPGPQRKSEARAAAGDGGAEAKLPRQMSRLGAARADCAITPLCERGFEMQRQKDLLRSCSAVVV